MPPLAWALVTGGENKKGGRQAGGQTNGRTERKKAESPAGGTRREAGAGGRRCGTPLLLVGEREVTVKVGPRFPG